jgi:putative FmdB family regulatory protein
MPTYEFRCPDGHTFDRFYRSISSAETEVACPECGKPATRQLSGGAGLLFKGSGFYLTDYGKNAHRGDASADKSKKPAESSSGSETTSAESKPAAETKTDSSSKNAKPDSGGSGTSTSSSSSTSPKSDK